jgi:hypothetical protein
VYCKRLWPNLGDRFHHQGKARRGKMRQQISSQAGQRVVAGTAQYAPASCRQYLARIARMNFQQAYRFNRELFNQHQAIS